jgi:hypothetical protein
VSRKPPEWSPEEVRYLSEIGDSLPLGILFRRFRRRAEAKGWPKRTDSAIAGKVFKLGLRHRQSRMRADDMTSPGGAAQILGCPADRVSKWFEDPSLSPILKPVFCRNVRYVDRKGWRRLANERPDVLGGFDVDRLFMLLEDRDLAEAVAEAYPYQRKDNRIRCIETGRIWPSASHAAREYFVTFSAICYAIRERRPVAVLGLSFERVRGGAV